MQLGGSRTVPKVARPDAALSRVHRHGSRSHAGTSRSNGMPSPVPPCSTIHAQSRLAHSRASTSTGTRGPDDSPGRNVTSTTVRPSTVSSSSVRSTVDGTPPSAGPASTSATREHLRRHEVVHGHQRPVVPVVVLDAQIGRQFERLAHAPIVPGPTDTSALDAVPRRPQLHARKGSRAGCHARPRPLSPARSTSAEVGRAPSKEDGDREAGEAEQERAPGPVRGAEGELGGGVADHFRGRAGGAGVGVVGEVLQCGSEPAAARSVRTGSARE